MVLCYNRTGSIMLLLPKLFQFGHVSQTCVISHQLDHELKSTYPTWPTLEHGASPCHTFIKRGAICTRWSVFPTHERIWATCHNVSQRRHMIKLEKIKKHAWCGASIWFNSTHDDSTFSGFSTLCNLRNFGNLSQTIARRLSNVGAFCPTRATGKTCYDVPHHKSS